MLVVALFEMKTYTFICMRLKAKSNQKEITVFGAAKRFLPLARRSRFCLCQKDALA